MGLLCGWSLAAQTVDIQQISIQGNVVIPASTILTQIESKEGLPYNPEIVTKDVQRIYDIGFFSTVEVDIQEVAGGMQVTYVVEEYPVISKIEFQGNKRLKEEKFEEVLELSPSNISDIIHLKFYPQKIHEDRQRLLELYHSEGYQNAKVSSEVVPDPEAPQEKVIVRYQIEENQKAIVRNVMFEGNTAFTAEELQKVMSVRRKNFLSWFTGTGKYAEEMLEADRQTLREFYRDHGYLDANVVDVHLDFKEDSRDMFITITIEEGDVYTIAEVSATGYTVFSEEEVQKLIKLAVGDPFSPSKIRGDMYTIADEYAQKGYVQPISGDTTGKFLIEPEIQLNREARQVSVKYSIREGVPHTVNRITITGNKNTRDKVIRREIKLQEGDRFNSEYLRQSLQKVFNLGLFEEMPVLEMLEGAEPNTVDLVFNVTERYSIGSFNFGGGWDTVDAWTVTGGISAHNLFGLAHSLDFSATLGSTSTLFSIDYSMPHFLDSPYLVGFDAYKLEREYSTYNKKSNGGGIRFGRNVTENIMLIAKYRYEDVNIYDVEEDASIRFKESEGKSSTSSMSMLLRRSTINNIFLPTKGMRTELQGEVAGGFLGADNNFYKVTVNNNIYFPLYKEIALRVKGEYGFVKEYGDSDDVPIFERFYGGGATTVRGYKERSIGPKDENEEAIGGNSRIVFTSEIIIPIQKQIRFVTFFDMGDVYGPDENFDVSTMKKSVGAGIRLNTPFGLMRFDYGYKLDDAEIEKDDKAYEFHFGLGNIF